MKIALRNTRLASAVLGLAAIAAFGPARGDGFDLNHYILRCADVCLNNIRPAVLIDSIDATFTGSWYDPNQGGQGLFLEILPNHRAMAFWFTFNPDGTQQAWIAGAGTYTGNVVTFDSVAMPSGGRWIPNFDATKFVDRAWGTMTLTFDSNDHGTVAFNSTLGFGSGSMNLVRLTRPIGINAAAASASGWSWTPASDMTAPRTSHTATLLADGRVLVAGGFRSDMSAQTALATTEIYDPKGGIWTDAAPLNQPRALHTATRLADGRVLVTGGVIVDGGDFFFLTEFVSTSELYDPATGAWRQSGTPNRSARLGHSTTLLKDGRVLLVGGGDDNGPRTDVELFDPATETWTVTGSMHKAGWSHSATLLPDGRVLVAGSASAELFDPDTGTWTVTASCGTLCGTTMLLADGKVLSIGAGHTAVYDPVTGKWGEFKATEYPRGGATKLAVDGRVLVAGGLGAQWYDGSTWSDGGLPYRKRYGSTTTFLADGSALLAGGYDTDTSSGDYTITPVRSAEIYGIVPGNDSSRMIGAWYDPVQSGHGLVVAALPGNKFLAWWFAFNPAGTEQAWFGGLGTYSGNTATITAVDRTTGGRFIPNFDPTKIVHNPWGSLTLTFTDCDHGKVDFASASDYGSGSMNLTRLTRPLGVTCP